MTIPAGGVEKVLKKLFGKLDIVVLRQDEALELTLSLEREFSTTLREV